MSALRVQLADDGNIIFILDKRSNYIIMEHEVATELCKTIKQVIAAALTVNKITDQEIGQHHIDVRWLENKIAIVFDDSILMVKLPIKVADQLWQAVEQSIKLSDTWLKQNQITTDGNLILQTWNDWKDRYDCPVDHNRFNATIGVIYRSIVGIPAITQTSKAGEVNG